MVSPMYEIAVQYAFMTSARKEARSIETPGHYKGSMRESESLNLRQVKKKKLVNHRNTGGALIFFGAKERAGTRRGSTGPRAPSTPKSRKNPSGQLDSGAGNRRGRCVTELRDRNRRVHGSWSTQRQAVSCFRGNAASGSGCPRDPVGTSVDKRTPR